MMMMMIIITILLYYKHSIICINQLVGEIELKNPLRIQSPY